MLRRFVVAEMAPIRAIPAAGKDAKNTTAKFPTT
jgi:hypothetical protein